CGGRRRADARQCSWMARRPGDTRRTRPPTSWTAFAPRAEPKPQRRTEEAPPLTETVLQIPGVRRRDHLRVIREEDERGRHRFSLRCVQELDRHTPVVRRWLPVRELRNHLDDLL